MEKQLVEKFRVRLENEKQEIAQELGKIAIQSKDDPTLWKARPVISEDAAGHDSDETMSDDSEEFGERVSLAKTLSQNLADINAALAKIAAGTYGKCENCDQDISIERLEAFPAARECFDCDGASKKS